MCRIGIKRYNTKNSGICKWIMERLYTSRCFRGHSLRPHGAKGKCEFFRKRYCRKWCSMWVFSVQVTAWVADLFRIDEIPLLRRPIQASLVLFELCIGHRQIETDWSSSSSRQRLSKLFDSRRPFKSYRKRYRMGRRGQGHCEGAKGREHCVTVQAS